MTRIDTVSVHGHEPRSSAFDALATPIACTATYTFSSSTELCDYFEGRISRQEYGRYGNPTVSDAERVLAELDGADDCALFASGMAAISTTLIALLKTGDHIVLLDEGYRRTRQLVTSVLGKLGVLATLVPVNDEGALARALRPETRVVFTESPTNPYLRVADLPALARACAKHGRAKLIVDATFATPANQRPLEFGADLVVHSCTKYLGGHNDLLAGSVAGESGLVSAVRDLRGVLGGILDPHAAYLLRRGIKTLALRVARQNESALEIARFLENREEVRRVHYPGVASHPDHAIAAAQMRGFGGVVSFELRGDGAQTGRFVDACRIAAIAPSLGGVETLIEQPAIMSYYGLAPEERRAMGISDSLVRLAVGIEDSRDLITDLASALEASGASGSVSGAASVQRGV
jgi:cystathionine gamma-synthase